MCAEIATKSNSLKPLTDFTGEADDYDIFLDVQFSLAASTAIANNDHVIIDILLKERA